MHLLFVCFVCYYYYFLIWQCCYSMFCCIILYQKSINEKNCVSLLVYCYFVSFSSFLFYSFFSPSFFFNNYYWLLWTSIANNLWINDDDISNYYYNILVQSKVKIAFSLGLWMKKKSISEKLDFNSSGPASNTCIVALIP